VVGVLHPGAMGAAIGSALRPRAGAVIRAAAGRSRATSKRAELADLVGVPDTAAVARRSDVIVSVCPPHAARAVADEVAAALDPAPGGRIPVYVDANAVSPATVHAIAARIGADHVVDGAIIGPPAWESGHTVLWLSGPAAADVAELFAGSPFAARVLGTELGTASALKACFALQSKALTALRLAMAEAADRFGVAAALREELARTGAEPLLDEAPTKVAAAAWRWAGEMDQAGDALAAVDVPDGFSRAAAEVYRRLGEVHTPADSPARTNSWNLR
jgi:3-hydroxyisobutyrate dehydrogenase-like beta-hydroxyacid dehydrogenase